MATWRNHDKALQNKADYLTNKGYHKLVYRAPGTNLTVELPKNHVWVGASNVNEKGHSFISNMPVEEVYTAPVKYGVNGYVSSTKPLNYQGNMIEPFKLTFEKGRIVDIEAEEGKEILEQLIDSDEGSSYLGEVALVPIHSPISQLNTLFYHTLFDENASNHFAIGGAYVYCIEEGKSMTSSELQEQGLNESIMHVDFMIGSEEMDIDGVTADNEIEAVFRNGDWAF